MVNLDTAPAANDEDEECPICEESSYVLVDNESEKVCANCLHAPTSTTEKTVSPDNEWDEWHAYRRQDEISGFYGPDRVKMVGGFTGAWSFGNDDYL
jgi:hypothetical protein